MRPNNAFLIPEWPAPNHIKSVVTTRHSPLSCSANALDSNEVFAKPDYQAFNLATHVGDELATVLANREILANSLQLPSEPLWLNQQHTDQAIEWNSQAKVQSAEVDPLNISPPPIADASWTTQRGQVLVVMTADCVPILLTDTQGTIVVAIHAGWQGIENQIIAKTLNALPSSNLPKMAWIGPCISQQKFEVGREVFERFQRLPAGENYTTFFQPNPKNPEKYFADLPAMAQMQLNAAGVNQIYRSQLCSYQDPRFYSYRQACHEGNGKTGRMASLIWIE